VGAGATSNSLIEWIRRHQMQSLERSRPVQGTAPRTCPRMWVDRRRPRRDPDRRIGGVHGAFTGESLYAASWPRSLLSAVRASATTKLDFTGVLATSNNAATRVFSLIAIS
jgi:hypothetical protein